MLRRSNSGQRLKKAVSAMRRRFCFPGETGGVLDGDLVGNGPARQTGRQESCLKKAADGLMDTGPMEVPAQSQREQEDRFDLNICCNLFDNFLGDV
jgi:hypothetical protein